MAQFLVCQGDLFEDDRKVTLSVGCEFLKCMFLNGWNLL